MKLTQRAKTSHAKKKTTASSLLKRRSTPNVLLVQKCVMMKSKFAARPSTVAFSMKETEALESENEERFRVKKNKSGRTEVYYKFSNAIEFKVIREALDRAGLKRVEEGSESWNILWGRHLKPHQFYKLNKYQKVNHFPKTQNLGNKHLMHMALKVQKKRFKKDYEIFPDSYFLPDDREYIEAKLALGRIFICKPFSSSCGRGISMITEPSDLPEVDEETGKCKNLIQDYIADPYLINNRKWDLRIYILVTSYNPLRIYFYDNGLVRFATADYSTDTKCKFSHLTNFSVNKRNEDFVFNTDAEKDDEGSKWSIKGLKRYFQTNGVDDSKLWPEIQDAIVKTIISVEKYVVDGLNRFFPTKRTTSCFELYGFDVMVDSQLKPWIIEVNVGPSFSTGAPLDADIKGRLLTNVLNLVGIVPFDRKKVTSGSETIEKRRRLREKKREKENQNKYNLPIGREDPTPPKEKEKPKPPNSLKDLMKKNYKLKQLSKKDVVLIQELEDELDRIGDFELIYPHPSRRYSKYFHKFSYNNALLEKWINTPEDRQTTLMNKYCTKKKTVKKKTKNSSRRKQRKK